MNTKVAVAAIVVVAVVLFAFRAMEKRDEQRAREDEARHVAERRIDLAALPEPESKPVDVTPIKPRLGKKPVIVELVFKQKRGKSLRPFIGEYSVVNATGETVTTGDADATGEPTVMILSPGDYEVRVPKKGFKQTLSLLGNEGDHKNVTVVVNP